MDVVKYNFLYIPGTNMVSIAAEKVLLGENIVDYIDEEEKMKIDSLFIASFFGGNVNNIAYLQSELDEENCSFLFTSDRRKANFYAVLLYCINERVRQTVKGNDNELDDISKLCDNVVHTINYYKFIMEDSKIFHDPIEILMTCEPRKVCKDYPGQIKTSIEFTYFSRLDEMYHDFVFQYAHVRFAIFVENRTRFRVLIERSVSNSWVIPGFTNFKIVSEVIGCSTMRYPIDVDSMVEMMKRPKFDFMYVTECKDKYCEAFVLESNIENYGITKEFRQIFDEQAVAQFENVSEVIDGTSIEGLDEANRRTNILTEIIKFDNNRLK